MSRIVVVGAGFGGLAVAGRLARAGHQVTVFEQAAEVGGKLGRWERASPHGVFRFDTGPSLLTLPQVLTELFADIGGRLSEADLVRLDPIVRHVFPDGSQVDSCADHEEFRGRIAAAFGPRAAADWARLWRRAERVWDTSWRHVLTANVDTWLRVLRLAWRLGDVAAVAPGRTLHALGHSHLRDPRLRMFLDRYATYVGSDPRRAPAALVAIPYAELRFGGWYLPGGLSRIADCLLSRLRDLGVTIHTGTQVASIETRAGRATGVRLADGTFEAADVVVANADAATVYGNLLPPDRPGARPARRSGWGLGRRPGQRSLSGFRVLLAVTSDAPRLPHHSVFFPRDYEAEFDAIFARPARPVPDPAILVTVPEDPAISPSGHRAWSLLVNAPPHGRGPDAVDWDRPGLADAYADRILDVLASRGVDVRDRVLFRDVLTPADLERRTAAPGGAIYGTASHGLAGLLRPANRTPVRGLFLVGGSVHPGGGLPLVALSAKLVAERIGPA